MAAALATGFSAAAPAMAQGARSDLKIKFGISIASLPIGTATVNSTFKGNRYRIQADGRTAGLSRLISDGRGSLSVNGVLRSGRVLPDKFEMDTVDEKVVTHVRMQMTGQSIRHLVALPPLAVREDRIPVENRHRRKVFDPLSAFLVPLDNDGRIEPEKACNRTIPVFDGWQRFDVRLSYKEERRASLGGSDGYKGPVVVCKMRYVPIAGHRPSRKATAYLAKNEKMELWLAPVPGLPVLAPVYVKIGTQFGPLTLHASSFDMNSTATQNVKAN